jgi:hypothetical protein
MYMWYVWILECLCFHMLVMKPPVISTAYLSVGMGRRCAGLVAWLVTCWMFGWRELSPLSCWSRRSRLWLGYSVYLLFSDYVAMLLILSTRRTWRIFIWWCILTMACICWRFMNYIPLWLLRYDIYIYIYIYACMIGFFWILC